MKDLKLEVRSIIGEAKNGVSRVTVSLDLFKAINDSVRARLNRDRNAIANSLPFTGMADEGGNGVRVFNVEGKDVYAHYNRENGRTYLFMKTEDAQAHLTTLAESRANEPKLPFNVKSFDLSIVSSASGPAVATAQ